jgi:hypothetical protein
LLFGRWSIIKHKRPELSTTGLGDGRTAVPVDSFEDVPQRELTTDLVPKYRDQMTRHH